MAEKWSDRGGGNELVSVNSCLNEYNELAQQKCVCEESLWDLFSKLFGLILCFGYAMIMKMKMKMLPEQQLHIANGGFIAVAAYRIRCVRSN